jgi:hypothetical protein
MRKLLLVALLSISGSALAHAHGYWRHDTGRWHWMAPAIVGGVVVYEATRPPAVVMQQPAVIYQPNGSVVNDSNCSPWTQIQNPDGTNTYTRTCK